MAKQPQPHVVQARCHCLRLAIEMKRVGETVGHILTRARLFERFLLDDESSRNLKLSDVNTDAAK